MAVVHITLASHVLCSVRYKEITENILYLSAGSMLLHLLKV